MVNQEPQHKEQIQVAEATPVQRRNLIVVFIAIVLTLLISVPTIWAITLPPPCPNGRRNCNPPTVTRYWELIPICRNCP